MSKKILFIEDEKEFAEVIIHYLKKRAFYITHVSLAKEGLKALTHNSFDLIILDLGLPDEDGLELCQKIREKNHTPILILTAKDSIQDKVAGLNLGADDYLVKPVPLRELVVRIERLFVRDLKDTFRSSLFQFGKIKFNTITGILTSDKKSVALTQKEKAVLEYLLLRKGQALSRMGIMDHVWGEEIDSFSNTINMVISSLRKKLSQLSENDFIQSVHGLGYKFEFKDG